MRWADRGRAAAVTAGVDFGEALDALTVPDSPRFEQWLGQEVLTSAGLATTGRVIVVTLVRTDESPVMDIVHVRLLTDEEYPEWRRLTDEFPA